MKCINLTDLISIILALFAIYFSIRYQIIALLNNQLSDKARECNSNLDGFKQIPEVLVGKSGIVSAVITAKEILNNTLKNQFIWMNKDLIVDNFYLQLHTSIREYFQGNDPKTTSETAKAQYSDSREFFKKSIQKDKEKSR